MEGVEQTKAKYTHSRIQQETPLNINLNINKDRQDYTIGTGYVEGTCGRGEGE
jgi:hypothetical protein